MRTWNEAKSLHFQCICFFVLLPKSVIEVKSIRESIGLKVQFPERFSL